MILGSPKRPPVPIMGFNGSHQLPANPRFRVHITLGTHPESSSSTPTVLRRGDLSLAYKMLDRPSPFSIPCFLRLWPLDSTLSDKSIQRLHPLFIIGEFAIFMTACKGHYLRSNYASFDSISLVLLMLPTTSRTCRTPTRLGSLSALPFRVSDYARTVKWERNKDEDVFLTYSLCANRAMGAPYIMYLSFPN
jgi:hypothetical protein